MRFQSISSSSYLLKIFVFSSYVSFFLIFTTSCSILKQNKTGEIEPVMERSGNDIGSIGYKAGIGDAIDIFVLEDSSFNGLYVVRPSGDIILPKAGRVPVLGLKLDEVESSVRRVLQVNQLTQATVIADPVRRGAGDDKTIMAGMNVYLTGPGVMRQGRALVPFVGDAKVTAFQAITDGGGFAAFANKKRSYLLRKDQIGRTKRLPIDFIKIEKGLASDPILQDGDTIVVPQKFFGF
jgi:protein involved in polysaccharide export with SLBB domain